MNKQCLRVCYFGTYRANYARNRIMIASLRAAGVKVIECHVPLWNGIDDRVRIASGQWISFSFLKRLFFAYKQLLKKYFVLDKDYDVMVLGYPGQLDVLMARLLTWLHRKPLALDLFMSVYLIGIERGLKAQSPLSMELLRLLEWWVTRLPNLLICDTEAYRDWHNRTYRLPPEKFKLIPTGADDHLFKPTVTDKPENGKFRALYYGTYIPNHGVETIVEAANRLKAYPEIQFELIGKGPTKAQAEKLVNDYCLSNVIFTNWLEKEILLKKIVSADLILGAFGTTPQSMMTIQNKIYEGLAMSKPVITGAAPTVCSILTHKRYAYLVERDNPQALAEGVLELYHNPELRMTLSEQGKSLYDENYSVSKLGLRFKEYLVELID